MEEKVLYRSSLWVGSETPSIFTNRQSYYDYIKRDAIRRIIKEVPMDKLERLFCIEENERNIGGDVFESQINVSIKM